MKTIYKAKYVLSHVIAYLPTSFLRKTLYKFILGYRIGKKVSIGWGSYIHANTVIIEDNVNVGKYNRIFYLDTFIMRKGASAGLRNTMSGAKFSLGRHPRPNYLEIGEKALITSEHKLDASFGIEVGAGTWIAGRACNFWSHGSTKPNDTIVIGKGCRFGANCNIGTGVHIGDSCLIGMGTVMTKSFPDNNCLIGGVPAKVIKTDFNWNEHWW